VDGRINIVGFEVPSTGTSPVHSAAPAGEIDAKGLFRPDQADD